MTGYLLDTNILSELTKTQPEPTVEAFLRESKDHVFLSVLSIGEMRKGIASLPAGNRRAGLQAWLESEIMPWFSSRLLPVTVEIAERWGDVSGALKTTGRPKPVVDSLLAATALTYNLIVVTRNVKDYEGLGVTILNPWEPQ